MILVIAEKPSVAQTIAAALGAKKKQDGYTEGNGYLISWCVGHLVQLADAAAYGEQYKKWSYDSLPILPQEWQYAVSADKGKQFKILKELMHRTDISEVVNACDAGREGELIFRFVYHMAGCNKPMRRLWISSMEESAIKAGFENLKDGRDYDALFASALCRAKADWIIGINATRLFSCLYNRTLNVGRVQTPTLKMLVDRDAAISTFQANYELVYSAELTPGTSLEDIYTRFNIDHPKDFKGHSLSVSDVVVLHQNGQDAAHYVDSFGYKNVPEFLQEQKQLTPDELETGETIKTPRGTFYVTDMSREQMEAAGYGFHHQSDDGKYLVMGNGTRAFAIAAEQRENPLKAAEQTTEQNENMIDGIINNTPTVDELEAKVKAGETISLVDLANAVKADKERGKGKPEKKPSIRAQLKADKEKAQKKAAAKTKNHDLEV